MSDTDTCAETAHALNTWLRYNTDYGIRINLVDIYGTIGVDILFKGETIGRNVGTTLLARLKWAMTFLEIA